jgi:hypothetical protein
MSALGHKRTFRSLRPMSALPPKADIGTLSGNVRFVPKADITGQAKLNQAGCFSGATMAAGHTSRGPIAMS